jgi:hypothetical protein
MHISRLGASVHNNSRSGDVERGDPEKRASRSTHAIHSLHLQYRQFEFSGRNYFLDKQLGWRLINLKTARAQHRGAAAAGRTAPMS